MDSLADIPAITRAIQQAVAPVFLLTGIGSLLNVLSTRLGRIVDRFRILKELKEPDFQSRRRDNIRSLVIRARWLHWAISFCTLSALCICLLVAALFIGAELKIQLARLIAMLFITAMFTLIAGLICFFREITLATGVIEKHR